MSSSHKEDSSINSGDASDSCVMSQSDRDFISQRAAGYTIDIVGRLNWIEDAWQMIQSARASRDETLRRS